MVEQIESSDTRAHACSCNARANLLLSVDRDSPVKLVIYSSGGAVIRTLVDENLKAGSHKVEWDGNDDSGRPIESGTYFYKMYTGIQSVTREMARLK